MKILLIEDNRENAELFIRMLNMHGYQDIAHKVSGVEGLIAARTNLFDVILIDFDLPDIHGTQIGLTLATLIQQKRLKPVPLIALTAQSDKASQADAERLGFDAFIGKPCLETDLIDTIRQLTDATGKQGDDRS
jgi:CheY-like chemotaxis protein